LNISIEVMLPTRGGTFNDDGWNGFPMLGIVKVYPRLMGGAVADDQGNVTLGPEPNMPRTGYIHLTGVPIERFFQIQRVLERKWLDGNGALIKQSLWGGVAASMPLAARTALRVNRQIVVTWLQFRNFLLNLRDTVSLTDADLDAA
jgi:hypothetical protein